MSLMSHIIQRQMKLPDPLTRKVVVDRDLRIPMRDGVELLADRWTPKGGAEGLPTALIRMPVRPFWHLRRDHGPPARRARLPSADPERPRRLRLRWRHGPHAPGACGRPGHVGLGDRTALVRRLHGAGRPELPGLCAVGGRRQPAAAGQGHDPRGHRVGADERVHARRRAVRWSCRSNGVPWSPPRSAPSRCSAGTPRTKKTAGALRVLPLRELDLAATGRRSQYIQDVLAHDADDPHWDGLDHRHRVAGASVPVSAIGGWYDIFLPGQLRDFAILQDRPTTRPAHGRALDSYGHDDSWRRRSGATSAWHMRAARSRPSGHRCGCS